MGDEVLSITTTTPTMEVASTVEYRVSFGFFFLLLLVAVVCPCVFLPLLSLWWRDESITTTIIFCT